MRRLGITALALTLGGCGPTNQEVGMAVLASLVVAVPIAAALNYGLYRLWRPVRELLPPTRAEAAGATFAAAVLATALNVGLGVDANGELVLIALWLTGSSYLTFFCVGIGLALLTKRAWVFRGVWWATALLVAGPATLMAFDRVGGAYEELVYQALIYPGGVGAVGGGLLLIVLGVSWTEWLRARARGLDGGSDEPTP